MLPAGFPEALRLIYDRLADLPVYWAITGSFNFALHGASLQPGDIDLQTDESGAYTLEEALAEFVIRPVGYRESLEKDIRSHYGKLDVAGVPVEIMGAVQKRLPDGSWEAPVDVEQFREFVEYEGMYVPVLALMYEIQAYRILGRREKAAMLEVWMKENNKL
ncbi:MAG: hypothetical protein JXB38_17780 [Anaerolineales bacterium]|nr:hypothetical protein [Anaerolineales bacterium]